MCHAALLLRPLLLWLIIALACAGNAAAEQKHTGHLPPDGDVQFRTPSTSEHSRWGVIGVVAIVLLQSATIGALLFERRRRRRAELESQRRLIDIAHIDRTLAAAVMSSSIAHELNQQLGAILSNAEAAEILLAEDPVDVGQLREILADIRCDDQRAGEIIEHLRASLEKGELTLQNVDLSQAVSGGRIWAENRLRRRTVFRFTLPLARAHPA